MEIAVKFFGDHIKVERVEGALKFEFNETKYIFQDYHSNFSRRTSMDWVYLDPKTKKEVLEGKDVTKCLWTTVPEEHMKWGVNDTDLLIYVSAWDEK